MEDLLQVPWYENSLIGYLNENVEHFNANFGSVLDGHAPITIMKIRYRQCPFMNQEIRLLVQQSCPLIGIIFTRNVLK